MSTTLSNQAQMQYVIQWFQEWSEMQRGDFLDIVMDHWSNHLGLVDGLTPGIERLTCKDESIRSHRSLFQCRVKLFREWSENWTQQEKDTLLSTIKAEDPKFAEKYEQRLLEKTAPEKDSS
ncbi:uncharacterized protein C14orf119 homolog [Orussus abietinus]|uniref:uncharacterized protein C14orf119 homolog n=1 Tax=Orussus abietinus TaxID=222816 RepID=UPI0006256A12|nr:uncharacterized protein C14orf119 homolog [Orussus abietinus]